MTLLVTVPHTGTRFFQQLIGCKALHVSPAALEQARAHDGVLITTIRDWDDVQESWKRRGRDQSFPEALMWWAELLTFNPVIVSIDCQREERLARLSEALGMDLKTDWMPVDG